MVQQDSGPRGAAALGHYYSFEAGWPANGDTPTFWSPSQINDQYHWLMPRCTIDEPTGYLDCGAGSVTMWGSYFGYTVIQDPSYVGDVPDDGTGRTYFGRLNYTTVYDDE